MSKMTKNPYSQSDFTVNSIDYVFMYVLFLKHNSLGHLRRNANAKSGRLKQCFIDKLDNL